MAKTETLQHVETLTASYTELLLDVLQFILLPVEGKDKFMDGTLLYNHNMEDIEVHFIYSIYVICYSFIHFLIYKHWWYPSLQVSAQSSIIKPVQYTQTTETHT